jgi:nucleoside-diphosphate-sugar epimerase
VRSCARPWMSIRACWPDQRMSRVLVTGSTGFVGRELCRKLAAVGFIVRGVVRAEGSAPAACAEAVVVRNVDGTTSWSAALEGVEFVVHLAAKAHLTRQSSRSAEYIEVNANGTQSLAVAAAAAGIRRFIYLSSVKVNGSSTTDRPFRMDDETHPDGPYGHSKWLGEKYLAEASVRSRMEPVILRPPLVYGPGVKANFLALLKWVDGGRPLPFGAVRNRRSLVSIWNLTDLILTILRHPGSAAGTWMVSDGEDLSTPALIELIATAMRRRARLLPIPTGVLRALGSLAGFGGAVERLCGSLAVDMSGTCNAFGWSPPVSVQEGICRTVSAYLLDKGS